MYNTDLPKRADLPTSAQLKRSTLIAAAIASALLVTVVMPSEYGIDLTRAGGYLGLTEMGEIKTQLAAEAAADAASNPAMPVAAQAQATALPKDLAARLDRMERMLGIVVAGQAEVTAAEAARARAVVPAERAAIAEVPVAEVPVPEVETEAEPAPVEVAAAATEEEQPAAEGRRDTMTFTLAPGEGVEVKLVMREGAKAYFAWIADGGVVNYDTHGDNSSGQKISYEKGRAVPADDGELEAAFDGNHGWFWRNRSDAEVTVTLETQGDYIEIKRVI